MRAWGKRDPHIDPWTIGRGPGAPKQWAATDLRAWSSGQRYTAAMALAFALIVVTTSKGPASGADDFLDGIGDGAAVEVADARAVARRAAAPSLTVGPALVSTAPAAFPEPVAPAPAPAPEPAPASPAEEPSPAATPPPPSASPSPSPPPSSPPPDEPDESPLGGLPVPVPLP